MQINIKTKKMKIIKLSIVVSVLFAAISASAQNADEILQKHEKAIGGTENWDKIKTVKMTGSMSMQGMDLGLTQTMILGKAMRTDITVMGITGFTIVTTTQGWMYMPFQGQTKVDTMKPEMVMAAQKQLDIKSNQLLDYKTNGTRAEYVGTDTVNGNTCFKIKFTDKEGNESTSYFDKNTYYLVRTENKLKSDSEEMEVAVLYDKYKKMDEGVVMPMSVTAQGAEITFTSIELNKPVDEKVFIPTIDK